MDLLARRPHFRRELVNKLAQRDYTQAEIESTLERLATQGLIDDKKLTEDVVRRRLERDPVGRRRLLGELQRRGAPLEESLEALDTIFPENDTDLARRIANRWLERHSGPRASLARHLERRGFSKRAIVTLLEELLPRDPFGASWLDP